MKTVLIAMTAALLTSGAAYAEKGLDLEATSSIDTQHVRVDEVREGSNLFQIRYTLNADGSQNIIQKTFKNSDG